MADAFYQLNKEEVLQHLKTSPPGSNSEVADALQKEFGANALKETKQESKLSILLAQFTDVMILILILL